MAWDTNNTNDWSNASLQKYLNREYYNSLSEGAKRQVSNVKWYLGGTWGYDPIESMYVNERGTHVSNKNQTNLLGKIGLIYSSDYVYASGTECAANNSASTMNNDSCQLKDWIYATFNSKNSWTIQTYWLNTGLSGAVMSNGNVTDNVDVKALNEVYPTLYVNSNTEIIINTDGSKDNPYELLSE